MNHSFNDPPPPKLQCFRALHMWNKRDDRLRDELPRTLMMVQMYVVTYTMHMVLLGVDKLLFASI